MSEVDKIMNSPILWVVTAIAIALILTQTILILKKSLVAGEEMNISQKRLKTAFSAGAVASIGPSFVIVIGMVSLLIVVGGPTALMRLAYIGNVAYELLAAQFAADAYGVSLQDSNIPPEVFSTTLWTMAVGCIGWIVVTALLTDKMKKIERKLTGNKTSMVAAISSAAMLGAYGYMNAGYAVSLDANTLALCGGFGIMLILTILYRKTKIQWLNQWSLTISMISGVLLAAFFGNGVNS